MPSTNTLLVAVAVAAVLWPQLAPLLRRLVPTLPAIPAAPAGFDRASCLSRLMTIADELRAGGRTKTAKMVDAAAADLVAVAEEVKAR